MARCTTHHKELKNGVGKCSVPMWSGYGMPAGFCDKDAYGPMDKQWHREREWVTGGYVTSASFLACPIHGGPKAKNPALGSVERADWKGSTISNGESPESQTA